MQIGDINGNKVQVGDLVKIRQSYRQKMIGKLAVVVACCYGINVTIHIIDTGKQEDFHIKKLEVLCK